MKLEQIALGGRRQDAISNLCPSQASGTRTSPFHREPWSRSASNVVATMWGAAHDRKLGRAGRCSAFLATASANRSWHRLMCAPVAGGVLAYRTLRLVASSAPGCPRAVRRWCSIHWTSSTTMVPSPCLECENRDGYYTRVGVCCRAATSTALLLFTAAITT